MGMRRIGPPPHRFINGNCNGVRGMKCLISVALLFALAGSAFAASKPVTESQLEVVRKGMEDRLKDADSAKFRNVRIGTDSTGMKLVCGEVNAKNGFGAYVGFVAFYGAWLDPSDFTEPGHPATAMIMTVDDAANGGVAIPMCKEAGL